MVPRELSTREMDIWLKKVREACGTKASSISGHQSYCGSAGLPSHRKEEHGQVGNSWLTAHGLSKCSRNNFFLKKLL